MADATAAFFDALAQHGHAAALEKATGSLRFDLTDGKRITHWLVTIAKGDIKVSRENRQADGILRADRAVFDGVVKGEANAMAALLRGAIAFEGDPGLLVLFQRLFPGPPSASDPRRAAGYARRQS